MNDSNRFALLATVLIDLNFVDVLFWKHPEKYKKKIICLSYVYSVKTESDASDLILFFTSIILVWLRWLALGLGGERNWHKKSSIPQIELTSLNVCLWTQPSASFYIKRREKTSSRKMPFLVLSLFISFCKIAPLCKHWLNCLIAWDRVQVVLQGHYDWLPWH